MGYPHPQRTDDDYDPWTLAGRCRASVLGPYAKLRRCFNRTTNADGLCWRHTQKEEARRAR